MKLLGIDGHRKGWICVWIDSAGNRGFNPDFRLEALTRQAGRWHAMIDIPVGLPDTGYRACDLAARKMLGPAGVRVFLGVRRPLLRYEDFAAASAWAKRDGKGISIQAFHILPKIAELDALMTPGRQQNIREMHPELVFWRLNGRQPVASKHTEAGLRQRRALLKQHGFDALPRWRKEMRRSGAKEDDLLDACAGALAAPRPTRVACASETDACGLKMDIWY